MIDFLTVAWGEKYISHYFNFCLKSIIDSKNSKNLNNSFKLNLIIPIEEKHILEKHIKSIVQNEINIIYFHDELKSVTKYERFNILFNEGLNNTISDFIIPLYPDMIVSYNFLREVVNFTNSKTDIFFLTCPRVVFENLKNLDMSEHDWNNEKILAKFILKYSHSKMKYMTWNSEYFNNSPAWLIFEIKNCNIYYTFHSTPLLIKRSFFLNINFNDSLDSYISSNYQKYKYKSIKNNKSICWLSHEEYEIPEESFKNIKSIYKSIKVIKQICNQSQIDIGIQPFTLLKDNETIFIKLLRSILTKIIRFSLFFYFK